MSSPSYAEAFHKALQDVACSAGCTVSYEQLLKRIAYHIGMGTIVVGRDGPILPLLATEIQAQRVVVSGDGQGRSVMLTPKGATHYAQQRYDYANVACSTEGLRNRRKSEKHQALKDYARSAEILAQVVHVFRGHEPDMLLRDVRGLPNLVRENLSTVAYLEEDNQAVLDQINQTHDRLDDMGWRNL
ncbi:hypothetical protein C8Q79DRAFT_1011921 [Trametes meyenii]|nr:hypothetical protein C8Q79DRAFT_1011921 [Trametes meyenii]